MGKLILKEELKQKDNTINISELADGIYFYRIQQKTTTIGVGKVIKR